MATAAVEASDGLLVGTADLTFLPAHLRELFGRYESIVDGQAFSTLDPVEDEIADLGMTAKFDDGREFGFCDLQVFPVAGRLSFRLAR